MCVYGIKLKAFFLTDTVLALQVLSHETWLSTIYLYWLYH
jgi:hypothetical protein